MDNARRTVGERDLCLPIGVVVLNLSVGEMIRLRSVLMGHLSCLCKNNSVEFDHVYIGACQ